MKIAIYQMDSTAGAFEANADKMIAAANEARQNGAEVLITPAFSLTGTDLQQLLHYKKLDKHIRLQMEKLKQVKGISIIFGVIEREKNQFLHRIIGMQNGKTHLILQKEYNEKSDCYIELVGKNKKNPLIYFDNSPFSLTHYKKTQDKLQKLAKKRPVLCVRVAGGQDACVFDGSSFALNARGELSFQAAFNQECLEYLDFEDNVFSGSLNTRPDTEEELLYNIAVQGLKNYISKNGFQKICLGLSGGLDSALVLAMAVDAVGAENCEVLLMPSIYTAEISNTAAEKMAQNLGVRYESVPIWEIYQSFKTALAHRFDGLPDDITEENLQARIRGTLLMALSNKTGALLLSTGNKSEVAMGYATLYGDMNGGFAPIKDLYKTQVFAISRWLNVYKNQEIIPQEIIDRKPSAELRPNQTDQDSLPEYAVLDEMLYNILENNATPKDLIKQGFDENEVRQIFRRLYAAEYKRRQGAIGTKLSNSAFGIDWTIPLTHKFKPE
ncbi:MAG: NAD(+) synthase [Neisseriaceae bacterium]|nr:NAD(+) synthase [Neisseriaceae bacterium]